jgi:hypothetical protein
MGEQPLRVGYPNLFAICSDPMLLVASAAHEGTWNIAFRRTFGREETAAWVELRARLPPPSLLLWIVLLGDWPLRWSSRLVQLIGPYLEGPPYLGRHHCGRLPYPWKQKDLCMANATRSFAFRGRGDQETWAGGRIVSIMQDPRVGNPHNFHLSPQPVSVELCPGGLGPAW